MTIVTAPPLRSGLDLKAMHYAISIFLCVQLLLASMFGGGMEELIHIPELVGHYKEHQLRDPGIGLIGFAFLHVAGSAHGSSEPERHAQLPFGIHHSLPQVVLDNSAKKVITVRPVPETMATVVDSPLSAALHAGGVFHPPKTNG